MKFEMKLKLEKLKSVLPKGKISVLKKYGIFLIKF